MTPARRWYARMVEQGLCVNCGAAEAEKDKRHCAPCGEFRRLKSNARYERRKRKRVPGLRPMPDAHGPCERCTAPSVAIVGRERLCAGHVATLAELAREEAA